MRNCDKFFGKHNWSKWTVVSEGRLASDYGRGTEVGTFVRQKRECEDCGIVEYLYQRFWM